jgi:hypothetical protein
VASPVAVTLLSTEYQGEWTLHCRFRVNFSACQWDSGVRLTTRQQTDTPPKIKLLLRVEIGAQVTVCDASRLTGSGGGDE